MRLRSRWFTKKRALKRAARRNGTLVLIFALFVVLFGGLALMQSNTYINPSAYTPLMELIAKAESNGNYNAYFNNASNKSIEFTQMTLEEVLAWQDQYAASGNPSNAVGRYQIIKPTLVSLIQERSLKLSDTFNETLQDSLAITLMERRGSVDFIKGKLSKDEFAHNLSQEWAALPVVIGDNPNHSYYTGDGLNQARVEVEELRYTIETFAHRAKATTPSSDSAAL